MSHVMKLITIGWARIQGHFSIGKSIHGTAISNIVICFFFFERKFAKYHHYLRTRKTNRISMVNKYSLASQTFFFPCQ